LPVPECSVVPATVPVDVLLVSSLISILVVLAFTDLGVLAYVLTGLVFAALLLASAITNRRRRATRR
jgi:hypothetical protein